MTNELRTSIFNLPDPNEALTHSADLLAFFQPMREQQLWGRLFLNRDNWPFGSDRYEVYFGYTALLLAGIALFAVSKLRGQQHERMRQRRANYRLSER